MNEYISKQSVLDYLNGYLHSLGEGGAGGTDDLVFDRGQRRALINAIQDISAVEAADVQPVKCGQWIWDSAPVLGNPYGSYRCSECGNRMKFMEIYCCGCGARMEEEGENETD